MLSVKCIKRGLIVLRNRDILFCQFPRLVNQLTDVVDAGGQQPVAVGLVLVSQRADHDPELHHPVVIL